jgi:hypothetical protein
VMRCRFQFFTATGVPKLFTASGFPNERLVAGVTICSSHCTRKI